MPKTNTSFDFGGWATKNNLECSDGRTILPNAFKANDGQKVPLVWGHDHSDPEKVLGHAILENRPEGVYAYCTFNTGKFAQAAKVLLQHGDINTLSIWANQLVEKSKKVAQGKIREVSLVLAGANPGALIDNLTMAHEDGSETPISEEAIIYTGLPLDTEIQHADNSADGGDETVEDVFNTLDEKQKTAVYAIISEIIDGTSDDAEAEHSDITEEGDNNVMKHNVFEGDDTRTQRPVLSHDEFKSIVADAKNTYNGSFKKAAEAFVLAHATTYGIENIDILFPDAKNVYGTPTFIKRETGWVSGVMNGTRHSPFSRVKTVHADITADTARAFGYGTKGALKKEEFFTLMERETTPTTVYKKQKLDRDDIVDIVDFDVVSWMRSEMRLMLDEEIARAILVTDGRAVDNPDKIKETNVRSIWKDDALYSHKVQLAAADDTEKFIDTVIESRVNYKGSGDPVLYTTTAMLTKMLLLKDTLHRRLYANKADLCAELRVRDIVEVPVMDGLSRTITDPAPATLNLLAILVNLQDYTIGADKGGAVASFDDFDIDYNQYKYLLETRISGALTLPKSALVFEQVQAAG